MLTCSNWLTRLLSAGIGQCVCLLGFHLFYDDHISLVLLSLVHKLLLQIFYQDYNNMFHTFSGIPDTPSNCSVIDKDFRTLRVRCVKGFDGGLPQQFYAEVRDQLGFLVRNISTRGVVEFNVTELEPGVTYKVTVYSGNGKGRSADSLTVTGTTEKYEHTTLYQRVSGNIGQHFL